MSPPTAGAPDARVVEGFILSYVTIGVHPLRPRGEIAASRIEDQEATMLSLHLLQNCMICVNTLMSQRVLGEPICAERMGSDEQRGMPPLAWGDVNLKGTFCLDMTARLPLNLPMLGADARQFLFQGV